MYARSPLHHKSGWENLTASRASLSTNIGIVYAETDMATFYEECSMPSVCETNFSGQEKMATKCLL